MARIRRIGGGGTEPSKKEAVFYYGHPSYFEKIKAKFPYQADVELKRSVDGESLQDFVDALNKHRGKVLGVICCSDDAGVDKLQQSIESLPEKNSGLEIVHIHDSDTDNESYLKELMSAVKEWRDHAHSNVVQLRSISRQMSAPPYVPDYPWLTQEEGVCLVNDSVEGPIALLDFDGTLGMKFTMQHFLSYLVNNEDFNALLSSYDDENQTSKVNDLNALVGIFTTTMINNDAAERQGRKPYFNGKFETYEGFLNYTADLYAKLFEGLNRDEVMKFSHHFAEERMDDVVYPHTYVILDYLKEQNITPAIVSGAPRESIYGISKKLGFETIGNFLELKVDENGIYTGEVACNTGLGGEKGRLAKLMKDKGNHPRFAAGDSGSDQPMINEALRANEGSAIFFPPTKSANADAQSSLGNYNEKELLIAQLDQNSADSKREVAEKVRKFLFGLLSDTDEEVDSSSAS